MIFPMSWRVAYWFLLITIIVTAALNMLHVSAGFLTNHAADLFVPAWMYVVLRHFPGKRYFVNPLNSWLGKSPELAAISLFIASALTEFSQLVWPKGIFPGTFDSLDIIAYGFGLLVCYVIDKRNTHFTQAASPASSGQPGRDSA